MSPDERAVHELHSTWIKAVNAGDLSTLLALMTEDAIFLNPGKEPFGQQGFRTNFLEAHQRVRIQCVSELEEVVIAGDVAYTRSRDALSVALHAGGEAAQLAGYRLTVYRRHPEGHWQLARDIHTLARIES